MKDENLAGNELEHVILQQQPTNKLMYLFPTYLVKFPRHKLFTDLCKQRMGDQYQLECKFKRLHFFRGFRHSRCTVLLQVVFVEGEENSKDILEMKK